MEKPTLNIDLKIHARLQEFIPRLLAGTLDYVPRDEHLQYLEWCRHKTQKYPTVMSDYKNNVSSMNPYLFMDWFFKSIPNNATVVAGNGSACVIGFQVAKIKSGQRLFTNSGNASMGYDLPAAIGASIASGNGVVYCLAGDGSLMMNLQELQTVKYHKLPIKIIVINNNGYHSIRQTQNAYFSDNLVGIGPDDGVSFPDFLEVAKAFEIPSVKVSTEGDLQDSIFVDLFTNDKSALIEVMIDPNQNFSPKLASRKMEDGTMLSPSLEDMFPFLDPSEMHENKF
jgi:acetolactate synthase-1/2/3 large subunit